MHYITRQDNISALPLSGRSLNCLRRADIHTIGAIMDYPADELINIRNMGKKSVDEIQSFVQSLHDGTGEYVLVEASEAAADETATAQKAVGADGPVTVFLDKTGAVVQDIAVKTLQLSVRAKNSLIHSGYEFASQLVGITYEELMKLQSMGKKTAEEVLAYIEKISVSYSACTQASESNDPGNDLAAERCTAYRESENIWYREVLTVFLDETGAVVQDIAVKTLQLSVRAKNSLIHNGYEFASQLVGITYEELMKLQSMGRKTAEEVLAYIEKISVSYGVCTQASESNAPGSDPGNDLAAEMCTAYGESKNIWYREVLTVKAQFPEAMGETLIYHLYDSVFVRGTVKAKILRIIEENGDEISKATLRERLPQHFNNTTILEEILLELESISAVETGEVMIHRKYPSVIQFVMQLQNDREREVLQARLSGKTLQEIGDQYGITRERVRQLSQKVLRKKPQLREDKYAYIHNNYAFSAEDLLLAFDEPQETYNYLEMISTQTRVKRKSIEELLTDTNISPELRRKAEKAIYKQYVAIDGVRVKKVRADLVKHFVKTLCKSLTKYDDFIEMYHTQIDALGLSDNPSLLLESRTYENKLHACDYVLWNQGRCFRYYNIPEHDYEELFTTLNLDEYEDVEISALKLFRDYPELMQQYDIRDENELHSLLKKIWTDTKGKVNFGRMPTIEIGTIDRNNQVLSLLLQHAPISGEDFAALYEETYGIKASTVSSNYMAAFDTYYFNGVYSIDFAALPVIQYNRMKAILDRDFYTIQEVKRLYKREFPHSDESLINPYTLKTIGFRVYSGYVVKNTYPTAVDYFRYLLTTDSIVDVRNISKSIQSVVAFSSELYKLRADYEIVEFAPQQYINIRRLNTVGVTTDHFENYQKAVANNYEKGEYFTVTSLRQDGFTHEMDDLGFDEWFYSSVLLEDRVHFSYQRTGGSRLFLRGKSGANLGDMLVWLLEKYQKIDIYDLMYLLENHYGITVPKEKLLTIIGGTELYYDTIMEAVYIDYDTYFEEI